MNLIGAVGFGSGACKPHFGVRIIIQPDGSIERDETPEKGEKRENPIIKDHYPQPPLEINREPIPSRRGKTPVFPTIFPWVRTPSSRRERPATNH